MSKVVEAEPASLVARDVLHGLCLRRQQLDERRPVASVQCASNRPTEQQWDEMIVNLTGVWESAKAVAPYATERRTGSIVITGSLNAIEPGQNNSIVRGSRGWSRSAGRAGAATGRSTRTGR